MTTESETDHGDRGQPGDDSIGIDAPLPDVDVEALAERVDELEDDLEARTKQIKRQEHQLALLRKVVTRAAGYEAFETTPELPTLVEEARDRLARLDELERVEETAETALAVANTQARDPTDVSKKRVALLTSRNELVRRAAANSWSRDRAVSVPQVREMARPEHELKYQTVKDAWNELLEEYECVYRTTTAGNKALNVHPERIPRDLARAVEHDLDRDGLAAQLLDD
jgi:hypothetical protein